MSNSSPLRPNAGLRNAGRSTSNAPVVMIVDDDQAVRHSLSLMLRANGYRVQAYSDGPDLLERPLPDDADILLVDYVMPKMDGLELVSRLRALGWSGSVVLITGRYDRGLRARAGAAGVANVLEKPLDKAALLQVLAAAD